MEGWKEQREEGEAAVGSARDAERKVRSGLAVLDASAHRLRDQLALLSEGAEQAERSARSRGGDADDGARDKRALPPDR